MFVYPQCWLKVKSHRLVENYIFVGDCNYYPFLSSIVDNDNPTGFTSECKPWKLQGSLKNQIILYFWLFYLHACTHFPKKKLKQLSDRPLLSWFSLTVPDLTAYGSSCNFLFLVLFSLLFFLHQLPCIPSCIGYTNLRHSILWCPTFSFRIDIVL